MARTKIWKDALHPGTWVTTKGQVFECEEQDLRHFHDRTKAMLGKGACIPWTWEHQTDDDAIGLSASDLIARWAKNTGGHIHDVRLANPEGPLEVLMDVDDADKPKLESIKYVSPDIRHNWRDRNGPASDDIGPFWPGQSFAHIAITPMPVQYPQAPFQFDKARSVSLSAAVVDVSLSAAKLQAKIQLSAKDDDMPLPDTDDDNLNEPPADTSPPPPAPPPDLTAAVPPSADGMGDDAHLIQQLSEIVGPLGIDIHHSPGMTLQSYVQHLCTAFKTHQATKGGPDDENLNEPATDKPDQTPQEPEIAESAPIMMSTATAPTEREKKLAKKLVKASNDNLRGRIGVLHGRGYIDDKIKGELESELGTIKLSMADLTDDGDLKPNAVSIQVAAYERLMKSGKPGSFAKPKGPPAAPGAKPNPHKPISSGIALSAAEDEEVVEAGDGDGADAAPDPRIIDRLSGGRYAAYRESQKNGQAK